jgi:drug/metabolite transporter (DMT)-like permease
MKKSESFCSLKWGSGFALLIGDSLIRIVVLPYASLVLLSTSEATSILSGIVLSYMWLKEKWYTSYFVGVPLILIGCDLTMNGAAIESPEILFDEVW